MGKIVIVDIDGTIAKVGERAKFLQQPKPDWDAFYNACFDDEPINEVVELVKLLNTQYNIVYCTGRRESVRDLTVQWLKKHNLPTFQLLMRPNNDYRHDTDVKPSLLRKNNINFKDIAFVLEDRNSMVKKWRELGLICLQVAEGDF